MFQKVATDHDGVYIQGAEFISDRFVMTVPGGSTVAAHIELFCLSK
jgi:hypothetical protein